MIIEDKQKFHYLACSLSPENLFEDGELNAIQAKEKENQILIAWKKLEKELNVKVSLEEAEEFYKDII